jgi:hypothetical protein
MRTSLLLLIIGFLTFCSSSADTATSLRADITLSQDEQHDFLLSISRYIGRLPRHGSHENKFESRFDDHYAQIATDHRLELLYVDSETGFTYFLATRFAPSLYERRVAIGGRLQRNEQDSLVHYEELFRTWKMDQADLAVKSAFLFEKMVDGTDLTPWTPEHSGEEEYIEFPNSLITYDPQLRQWTSTVQ